MTTEVDSASGELSDDRSDAELITAVRAGDSDAYAALYARHSHAATRLARTLARDRSEADDLVAEAFTRILATLHDGRGPDLAFRAYLHTTIRHTHYDRARAAARTRPVDEVPEPEPGPGADDPAIDTLNRSLATRAFQTLPERWQLVLWHTEVEGDTPAAIAPLLGLTPNGVAALAYRARERLRQAYLQAHLTDTPPATSCATITPMLAADIRGNLSTRDHGKVAAHLGDCATCTALYTELTDLNNNLAALLAPAILGTTWAAYLGTATAAKTGILATLGAAGGSTLTAVRETFQKLGPRNTAIGAGVAAAVAAAALAATLIATDQPVTPPRKPPAAQPPAPPPEAPPEAPPPSPDETPPAEPTEAPPVTSEAPTSPAPTSARPSSPAPSKTKKPRPTPSHPLPSPPLVISPGKDGTVFTSGESAVLPITIDNNSTGGGGGEFATQPPADGAMTLWVRLPAGFRFTGEPAGDGWRCDRSDAGVECSRTAIQPGESTTAELRIHVDKYVRGEREITAYVAVDELTADRTYRVTVQPKHGGGYRKAYHRRGSVPE